MKRLTKAVWTKQKGAYRRPAEQARMHARLGTYTVSLVIVAWAQ